MGLSFGAKGCLLLLTACLLAVCEARTIVVGGSEGWHYGFNYTDWAIQNSPFYFKDKLVYSVYLLPNLHSYITCDFSDAKQLADPKLGGGLGFVVELNQWRPYYFASNGGNGRHCDDGLMKFFAVPGPRV
ncbi:hypothetical protein TIFTF001_045077 [Ficus carica]|uniref:Phytocyanin domain-containing protein n=1 Tax=Ficus carica TaxID=3494 RepID=A0AA87Z6N6_FICCA|nr:hypothetical protein TIFTF001_045071 [Ficus carica]GMN18826.1 hypothetical protein TIFTF001_045073 [Ficus carica]GMN18831.1 hypothetical protein TIFTF001_045075 [Ficus carica]GMN18835.1 hypothetical protein TIFTF001_045077 [Ficus carica]